jgi:hypothetical protein
MGITPPHFNQASGIDVFPLVGECGDLWWQYSWQNVDQVGREDLARHIYDSEADIAEVLGYWPGPKWIESEFHRYPRPHRRDVYTYGLNVRGQYKSVIAKYGKFIQAGQRATSEVANDVTVVYSDPDGDGYNELATVSTTTTLTEACEIKVYFDGQGGNQEWEIRPAKSVTLSGGTITFTFDAWQLLDPDLWEAFPTGTDGKPDSPKAIALETASNYVTVVDVWREYTDFSEKSAEFLWEPKPQNTTLVNVICDQCGGTGCIACELTTQDGCVHVRDVDRNILVPQPATYDADNAQWSQSCWTECREPDIVKVWYYAGNQSNRYVSGLTCDPLDDYLAHAIAWMATARLERPICACNNAQALSMDLQRDMAFSPAEGGFFNIDDDILSNPFGTKKGEVMAWRRMSKLTEQIGSVALV